MSASTEARPLTPEARKREAFSPGVPVKLSDGRTWELALPVTNCYYPRRRPDGTTGFVQGYDFGPEYDRLTDLYVEADPEELIEKMARLVDAIYFLLARNYEVAFDDMQALVRLKFGDEESGEMWRVLRDVALGHSPKPTPVGAPPA